MPVIAAVELDDLIASGERAREPDARHRRFRAAVHHSHFFDGRHPFADLTISLPFNNPELLRKAIQENKHQIAAVIIEPIPANAGLYFPREKFLSILREECTSNDTLLIFDEVITGFRVARGGAQQLYGVKPDLTVLGKITGGGLPVGAFGGRAEIMPARIFANSG